MAHETEETRVTLDNSDSVSRIPISILHGRGHIYDVEHVKTLREKYHICGVLTGILPQFPQQNVFLGLPLELMPEDVRYLLEIGVASAIDDALTHSEIWTNVRNSQRSENEIHTTTDSAETLSRRRAATFLAPEQDAYAMYKFLMNRGCFIMPGLRFGSQFMAYPGDPLRFHAHYSAVGYSWHQKFAAIDIVGSGRLGTTVKKAWVAGAHEEDDPAQIYRAFSVEWAGFG